MLKENPRKARLYTRLTLENLRDPAEYIACQCTLVSYLKESIKNVKLDTPDSDTCFSPLYATPAL